MKSSHFTVGAFFVEEVELVEEVEVAAPNSSRFTIF